MSTPQIAIVLVGLAARLVAVAAVPGTEVGCVERSGMVCCGNKQFEQDPDKKCCRYGQDMLYISKWNCDERGFAKQIFELCRTVSFSPLFQGCCYNQTYDRDTRQCCHGSSAEKSTVVSLGSTCCDGRALGPDHLCCSVDGQERLVLKQHPSHTACCSRPDPLAGHNITTFSSAESFCSKGHVKTIPDLGRFAETINREATEALPNNASVPPFTSAPSPSPLTTDFARVRRPHTKGPALPTSRFQTPAAKTLPSDGSSPASVNSPCGRLVVGEGCCGATKFRLAEKTCCWDSLTDLPARDSVCCRHRAYRRSDPATPCCGNVPINRKTTSCCEGKWPYNSSLLTCDSASHGLTLGPRALRGQDLATQLCTRSLPELGKHWRAPELLDMVRVQGRVERCGVRFIVGYLLIPLTPAVVRQDGFLAPDCLRQHRLVLQIATPSHGHEGRGGQRKRVKALKKYLTDSTLDIYVQPRRMTCHGKSLTLRLTDTALIFRSRLMDAHLIQDSIGPREDSVLQGDSIGD